MHPCLAPKGLAALGTCTAIGLLMSSRFLNLESKARRREETPCVSPGNMSRTAVQSFSCPLVAVDIAVVCEFPMHHRI